MPARAASLGFRPKSKIALALLLAASVSGMAFGQAATKSFSSSLKASQKFTQAPNGGVPDGQQVIQGTFKHSFAITPAQEEMLTNSGGTIYFTALICLRHFSCPMTRSFSPEVVSR